MNFFRKKHKYETQSDLQNLSVEEIIRIDPKDIGLYIEEETGGNPLTGDKLKALNKLLAFKRNIPKGRPVPESMIQQFLNEESQINKMMGEATNEIVKENKQQTIDDLKMLDLTRGVDALNNRMPQPVTKDESIKRKWTNLGGRTRKLRKSRKSKKSKRNLKNKSRKNIQDNEKIWGNYGSVWSPKKKHYIRLGSPRAFNVIQDELVRDKEWHKRVKFMAKGKGEFGNKIKKLL
jgi:organic radical activating enzyme